MRQHRITAVLQQRDLQCGLFISPESVQYLTGVRTHRLLHAAVVLTADGRCTLFVPNAVPEAFTADDVKIFSAQQLATLRQEQLQMCLQEVARHLQPELLRGGVRIGTEFSAAPQYVQQFIGDGNAPLLDLDADLWNLRRRKDSDELQMIARAIDCTEAMYETAREIIQPGIAELDVYSELHRAAVQVAGEALIALGNDFQCNSPGGAARLRAAQAGELFILDLGPNVAGYYADNCRTISVDGNPTDEQMSAWQSICDVLTLVEQTVCPGVSCRQLYLETKAMLDEIRPEAFCHHLGHGFGLYPHEAPHLNPHWDDTFAEGDIFTAEPGLYWPSLKAGIRLEQNYRVTADGVELLTKFRLGLT